MIILMKNMDKEDLSLLILVQYLLNKEHGKITFSKCHRFPNHPPSAKSFAIFLHSEN